MTIGGNIRKFRKNAGLTQQELADRIGVSASAVGQFEKSDSLNMTTVKKIALALGVSADTLFTGMSPLQRGEFLKPEIVSLIQGLNIEAVAVNDVEKVTDAIVEALEKQNRCIEMFNSLNPAGQDKALELIGLVTKIGEYKKGGKG